MRTPTCDVLFHRQVKRATFEITNRFYSSHLLRKAISEFREGGREKEIELVVV